MEGSKDPLEVKRVTEACKGQERAQQRAISENQAS